jgi:hypothetical protein
MLPLHLTANISFLLLAGALFCFFYDFSSHFDNGHFLSLAGKQGGGFSVPGFYITFVA